MLTLLILSLATGTEGRRSSLGFGRIQSTLTGKASKRLDSTVKKYMTDQVASEEEKDVRFASIAIFHELMRFFDCRDAFWTTN